MDELSPLMKELTRHPVAFLGGFASGLFRLNLSDDPVKSWLNQRSGYSAPDTPSSGADAHIGNGSGPQSISIE